MIPPGVDLGAGNLRPGDQVLVSDDLDDHGITVLAARGELDFETDLGSDCRLLGNLARTMLAACPAAIAAFRIPHAGPPAGAGPRRRRERSGSGGRTGHRYRRHRRPA